MVRFSRRDSRERQRLVDSPKMNLHQNNKNSNNVTFQQVHRYIDDENDDDDDEVDERINETDLLFLKELMDSPILYSLVRVHEIEDDIPVIPKPESTEGRDLLKEVQIRCSLSWNIDARELGTLLNSPEIKTLIDCHDDIAKIYENPKPEKDNSPKLFPNGMTGEEYRMVGVRKKPGEPLGLTVQVDENGNLTIARIIEGGMIEKQGLLHVGDIILEVNGTPVATPEDLQTEIAKTKDHVTLKVHSDTGNGEVTHSNIVMANGNNGVTKKLTCYMRALYEYIPQEDTLLPCKEIGLPFDRGDILQIVDQRDPNWWQAKKVGGDGTTGLIPSLELEERRKAFVPPEADFVHTISICGARISKKKKKITYQSKSNCDFDKAELLLYEEVTKMPPFKRKTLVLIGTQGVGRRTLKNRLINSDPEKFGGVVPFTTRPPRVLEEAGQSYWFTDREAMEEDVRNHKFLEYGEYNGHLYGTHLDSIRDVIKQGKMCILDCSPMSLKLLHNSSEFLPYVIFIAAPGMEQLKNLYEVGRSTTNLRHSSRNLTEEDLKRTLEDSAGMQRTYDKYIDMVIPNNDFDTTFRQIIEALEALTTEHQWVPVNWIY
ncbi:protein PALS2 isoform X2 [Diabrotica virgifera virgifera]|uniref:MAGUK p55 subfamily member 6 isoform X2 n=1 Tax=Diabrotica virgifera virgifera TaxID=50390 RepID=A0A6P7GKR3_DIAVI|nr:protein PALS2 isoform X2 [Diabrotica virgifera virgifera]